MFVCDILGKIGPAALVVPAPIVAARRELLADNRVGAGNINWLTSRVRDKDRGEIVCSIYLLDSCLHVFPPVAGRHPDAYVTDLAAVQQNDVRGGQHTTGATHAVYKHT